MYPEVLEFVVEVRVVFPGLVDLAGDPAVLVDTREAPVADVLCVVVAGRPGARQVAQRYVTRVVALGLGSMLTAVLLVRYVKRESTLCLVAQVTSVQISGTHSARLV